MLSGELIHKSRVHLSWAIEEALHVKPQTSNWRVSTGRAVVIHASGDMLSPLAPSSVSRHQVVSWQSAGMQMCSQQRLNCYDSPICHRICSLPTALGPKLVSVQDIPAVWWIPPRRLPCHPLFQIEGSPSSPFLPPLLLRVLHISTLLFFIFSQRNISQQSCAQQGPKPWLQRTSHYPSRWCANVAVDIKVFQLIIRGIHWRQQSLSYNLATIRGILAEGRQCDAMVTLSWGQQSDTRW